MAPGAFTNVAEHADSERSRAMFYNKIPAHAGFAGVTPVCNG